MKFLWQNQILVYKTNVLGLNYKNCILLILILFIILILSGLWVFSSKQEHVLSILLSLEFLALGVYLMILLRFYAGDLFYSLIYITFTACEGALGLSVLVIIRRSHGGDYFKTFNIV